MQLTKYTWTVFVQGWFSYTDIHVQNDHFNFWTETHDFQYFWCELINYQYSKSLAKNWKLKIDCIFRDFGKTFYKYWVCFEFEIKKSIYYILMHIYGIRLSHIFEIPSISNENHSISTKTTSISIEILGISNQKFWNTRIFTAWIWNTGYFARKRCEIPGF